MAAEELKLKTMCPHCNKEISVNTSIPSDPRVFAPDVRCKKRPVGSIFVYTLSTAEITKFIIEKSRQYVPDVKVEVVPRYCEKKQRKDIEPHRSYASLRIAFSDNVVENNADLGWYGKIGESEDVKIVKSMYDNIIHKYQYDRKKIEGWLKNYKTLEYLEDGLGMTESYIRDLLAYCRPKRVMTADKESWVIFSAAAENVIADMLTDPNTSKPAGRIQIQDVYPVSKDIVEFIVHLNPYDMVLKENPHVRQILHGEEKPKK